MKRIGYFLGVGSIAFVLMTSYSVNKAFASGTKAASASEKTETKCLVCGKAIDAKSKPVTVKHKGKTFNFCCEHCADTFKKDPGKCLKDKGHQL